MLNALLIAVFFLSGQESRETGVVTGSVIPPQTVQVILLGPGYGDLWASEVQKRLDQYWQQYQLALRTHRELFSQFSRQAHRDATYYVVNRMRRDLPGGLSQYLMETSADGRFEFKNLPFGEYKILALGKSGNQDVMWQASIDVRSAIPQFLELKKIVP